MPKRLLRYYASTDALHLNGNIILSGLLAAVAAALAASWAGARFSSPETITGISTAVTALTFVPIHLALHGAVVCLTRTGDPLWPRYWRETKLIYATGAPSILLFLGFYALGQDVLLRFGVTPGLASGGAYVIGQVLARLLHTVLYRKSKARATALAEES
ncbi:hypothetical protein [Haliangium ochraceum]|uniref:Uncharacterized protein n=1 Tax=Haliangium ochraceum (strain DSM 14365 / JCM 11303 / SMP-2) TaxID=502025 RepID=D0LMR9_HALO1|nr:hypothetical protein [Haliangium ochraceum]ACY18756.1 hypothetical protein Hoch_6285 [Haliangium ochraceum DSM 14365]